MNGEKYESSYKLDSLLATVLLKKFKENDFSCVNKNDDCDKKKETLHEMDRDWNAVSGILDAVIKDGKH